MNKIEQMFYDCVNDLAAQEVSASVHSEDWEMKIAEYKFSKEEKIDGVDVFNLDVVFGKMPEETKRQEFTLFLEPQYKILSYTADFVFTIEGVLGELVKFVIEIDGHDWHEKTKSQAGYDKKRDREITKSGYYVLRFTGSEIYTNSKKCVCEILDVITSLCFEKHFEKYVDKGFYYKEIQERVKGTKNGN